MVVVIFCCHVQRYMPVCNVALQITHWTCGGEDAGAGYIKTCNLNKCISQNILHTKVKVASEIGIREHVAFNCWTARAWSHLREAPQHHRRPQVPP